MTAATEGLIVPEAIPGVDLGLDRISAGAGSLSDAAGALPGGADRVVAAWGGLGASYVAPESGELLAALAPVSPVVEEAAEQFVGIAAALSDFVAEATPIVAELGVIRTEAVAFVAEANAGFVVNAFDPDHPLYDSGLGAAAQLLLPAGGAVLSAAVAAGTALLAGDTWIPWTKHSPSIARNRELIERVNKEVARLDQAVADCVAAITRLDRAVCTPVPVPVTAEELGQEGAVLPWGSATRGDRTCYESFGDGVQSSAIDALNGIGALMAIDATETEPGEVLFQGDLASQAWAGLLQSIGVIGFLPVAAVVTAAGKDTASPWLRDATAHAETHLEQMWTGFAGTPEQWQSDPTHAAGRLSFGIGSLFLGGGAVGAGAKAADLSADLARAGARVRGVAAHAGAGIADLTRRLGHDITDAGRATTVSARDLLSRLDDHLASASRSVEAVWDTRAARPAFPAPAIPDHPITLQPVGNDSPHGGTATDAPVRAAGPREHTDTVPAARPTGMTLREWIATGRSPLHSGVDGVPGEWHREADTPAADEVSPYGRPHAAHGVGDDLPERPTDGQSGFDLRDDPEAPWGRDTDGRPFTKSEHDERYVHEDGSRRYPPNDGAVPGTRVVYTSVEAFIRDFGDLLDRIGADDGGYLGLRPDGMPASFEERSLPPGSLRDAYREYTLTGRLPDGWKIEVSEVAPGFGQRGGGIQVIVKESSGEMTSVRRLSREGILG